MICTHPTPFPSSWLLQHRAGEEALLELQKQQPSITVTSIGRHDHSRRSGHHPPALRALECADATEAQKDEDAHQAHHDLRGLSDWDQVNNFAIISFIVLLYGTVRYLKSSIDDTYNHSSPSVHCTSPSSLSDTHPTEQ